MTDDEILLVRAGDVLGGRYRILRVLGSGAMGWVFAAHDQRLETEIAVKVLRPELASHRAMVERFRREALEAARISHAGIAKVTDFERTAEGVVYLAMELLVGETFLERRKRAPVPIAEAVALTVQTLDALAAAHARGILHRDIKPENLFVVREAHGGERVKLLDFGIAKVREGREQLTGAGALLGTPAFMSPDQVKSAADVDARADVYSVGATLFFMLTGKPPASGGSIYDVISSVLAGDVARDPRELRPEVPAWLAEVVAKSLAHAPEQRFASAVEMKAALEAGGTAVPRKKKKKKKKEKRKGVAIAAAAAPKLIPPPPRKGALARSPAKPVPGTLPVPWLVVGGLCAIGLGAVSYRACRSDADATANDTAGDSADRAALRDPARATQQAPPQFKVRFVTTKGNFVIEATRTWAPHGVDRFYNLVKIGFFENVAFFRAVSGFMVQFGIHGEPEVSRHWRSANIAADAVKESNKRGYLSFAMAGSPDTRATQLFINYGDNSRLDAMGFAPIGKVVEGMDVVDSLYQGYGEAPSQDQGTIQAKGNAFLRERYPELDYLKRAELMTLATP